MAERLRREPLPPPWNYAVTADGRIFFINDETQTTTWIYPVTEEPVATGLLSREDLPKGWQQGLTTEGAEFFVDHNEETTTFYNPTTSTVEVADNSQFLVKLAPEDESNEHLTVSPKTGQTPVSVNKKTNMVNKVPSTPEGSTAMPTTPKVKNRVIPKNVVPQVKRRKDDQVTMKGWLHKMGSKFKVWRKVWCVISDFCLFYYKGPNDVNMQGSIVLPSYDIKPVVYSDKASKKYAFKCSHQNMRTVIFAAESEQDMKQWIEALSKAAKVQMDLGYGEPVNRQKEVRVSDDEDGGFSNFSQPTQSEIDHNRSRYHDNGHHTFEEEEQPGGVKQSVDHQDYSRPQSYQQRPNGYMEQKEVDNFVCENKDRMVPLGHYREDDPQRSEVVQDIVDDSATEDDGDKYSDDDIEEVYSEEKESRRNQTDDDYSLSRDKDYRRLGTQSHTPGLYPVSYRTLPRKRSSDYYSSMDDFTWEGSAPVSVSRTMREDSVFERPQDEDIHRRSAHDSRSSGQEYSDDQSLRSSQELPHRQSNPSHTNRRPDDRHRADDYYRQGNRRYDPDRKSATLQHRYSKEPLQSRGNTMPRMQDNKQYSSRDSLPSSHSQSPSSVQLPQSPSSGQVPLNYRRINDSSSQHSYASQRRDDSGSQHSHDSQKRDETSSLRSYDSQRRDISHDSGSRPSSTTTSPPIKKDYVDGGHIQRKRPNYLKFDIKHNNNYRIQGAGPSPEQRSVLQSPWDQDPPLLPKEQRSAINSPVTYNPPRPEHDAQPLRDGQVEFKNKDDEFPEQRSYLQSPLVQSNTSPPSLGHEQRSTINSPMVYEGNGPQWPSESMIDHHDMDNINHNERITPKAASSQHMAPGVSRSSTLDSKRSSSSQVRPLQVRSGYTEPDIAPTRNQMLFNSPPIGNVDGQKSLSREDVQNVYNSREGDLSRQSSRAGDHRERQRSVDNYYESENGSRDPRDSTPFEGDLSRQSSHAGDHRERQRSVDNYYGSQNGSRDPRDSTPFDRNDRHMRKSSGYDSYGDDSQVMELSKGRKRGGYSLDSREYVPHSQVAEHSRPRNERQSNGRASRETSISSGRLPTDRRKDYVPHDDVRKPRKSDYQQFADDLGSDSSSKIQYPSNQSSQRQPERPGLQQESQILPSRQNYQESAPTKRRPESMIRAMEEKERRSRDTFPSRGSSRRTTQEIFESEGRDQFPSMDNETQPRTTNRFRKWQQKLQPYIILNTGTRVRLSISADDLLGKPHEELVLLLIQLRRDQANLRAMNEMIRTEMTKLTDPDLPADSPTKARARRHSLKNPSKDFTEEEMYLLELNQQKDEVEKEIEISGPLVSLVDNLVRMGSLYGGQNEMIAQQYYRDEVKKGMSFKPPKKLIEFSRTLQEQRLAKDLEKELEELETVEDRELEDKLNHLHFLDTRLQEISVYVTDLKEDKDKIENALGSLDRQSQSHWDDPEAVERIKEQQHRLERDLIQVREELAYRTKELESITVENNRIEHEVKLLRTKMEDAKKRGSQSEADEMKKTRLQIEKELQQVQGMIAGLENQKNALALQMAGIRSNKIDNMPISQSVPRIKSDDSESISSYTVTDLDSLQSCDITQIITPQKAIPPPVLQRKESIARVKELKKQQMGSKEDPVQQRHSTPVASSQPPALSPVLTPLRIETTHTSLHPYGGVNGAPSSLLTTSSTSSGSPAMKDKKQTVRMRKRESERRKESDLRKKRSNSAAGRRSGTFDIRYDYKPKQRNGQKSLRRTASMPDRKSLMGEDIVPKKQVTEDIDRGIVSDSELEPTNFSRDLDLRDFKRAMFTADDEEEALQRTSSEHVLNSINTDEFRIDDESSGSLLGPPPKIVIPERYNPLSDDDYEELTEEEKRKRSERAEGIKKMLTSHSFQEWHPREFLYDWQETTDNEEEMLKIRQGLKEEKEKRENILQLKANLAEEIKQHTKLMGAQSMKVSPHTTGGEVER